MKRKKILAAVCFSLVVTAGLLLAATTFPVLNMPTGYIGQLEISSFDTTTDKEVVFKTEYEKNNWSGNVHAYPISADGEMKAGSSWWGDGAASQLDKQNFNTGRIIVTMNGTVGVPFRWSSISNAQQQLLGDNTNGAKILDYVRGDRSLESSKSGGLRVRESVLGDIQHSRPKYFKNSGTPVLFVGANDGMLHAFDAQTSQNGKELWAYIPSMLFDKLSNLADSPYVHNYFVDGGINVGKVNTLGVTKNVLVGTLGAGGAGLFAIDVTDPHPANENAAAANVLWEVSNASAGFSNLGLTYSTPVMTTVNGLGGQPAVIIGNGYNAKGASSLFVINTANGALIKEVVTGGGNSGGLSTPACVDTNYDGKIDVCYAGDIDGHLWKFDLSSSSPSDWSASLLFSTGQAITMVPAVGGHPEGGYMINFVTGRILTNLDAADSSTHFVYGIWDGAPASNSALLSQTLTEQSYSAAQPRVRVVTSNVPNWSPGGHKGWKVALPINGERSMGDTPFIVNKRFYFVSFNPTIKNTYPNSNGENWLMELNYLNGGVENSPFFDMNNDKKLDDNDRLGPSNTSGNNIPVGKFFGNGVASQPLLASATEFDNTIINAQPDLVDPTTLINTTSIGPGVSGGHFDFDIFYPNKFNETQLHVHEYDDEYDVTGVNMLNASEPKFNLSNAIPNDTTPFKILLQNQYLSPAVSLSVGSSGYANVMNYNGQASNSSAASVLARAPIYTRASPGFNLEVNMPVDAFKVKNGRVGLHPSVPDGCVIDGKDFQFNAVMPPPNGVDGPGVDDPAGARHNGALTIQLIKSDTTASQVEMNVAGRPEYGWRLMPSAFTSQMLAEYTIWWHHPNELCYGQQGWTKTPPEDFRKSGAAKGRPAGSSDPTAAFTTPPIITSVTTVTFNNGNGATTTTNYSTGQKVIVQTVKNADGTVTTTVTTPDGTTSSATNKFIGSGGNQIRPPPKPGRISWSEMRRK